MKLDEILDGEADAKAALQALVDKKGLTNTDKAKAKSIIAKGRAKRRNPKPGADLQLGSHINDPFAGDTGDAGSAAVDNDGSGANRY